VGDKKTAPIARKRHGLSMMSVARDADATRKVVSTTSCLGTSCRQAEKLVPHSERLRLLRQFMPKGTDLSDASQTWLNDVANSMNNRPRKTLGWRTPAEAMADEIAAFKSTVALDV